MKWGDIVPENLQPKGMDSTRHFSVPDSHGFDHGGQVHHYATLHGTSVNDIIDFSANINPLGPPALVLNAMQAALSVVRHYPDPNHTAVKEVLAQHFRVKPSQILCGNGASEVIDLLLQSLKPQRVVVLEPAFSEYRKSAQRHGIPVLAVSLLGTWNPSVQPSASSQHLFPRDLDDGRPVPIRLPLDELNIILRPGDLVFLNTPHNPTGACFKPREWMTNAKEWQERGVRVVVDESFLDFLPDETQYTAIQQAVQSESLFIIRSATKFYALPGLRFGFAIGPSGHFHNIEDLRDGWSVNQLAQIAAAVAYKDKGFQRDTWEWLQAEQQHVRQIWAEIPNTTLYMGQVNFFLLHFHHPGTGQLVEQHLHSRGMLIRNCSTFAGLKSGFYRIAIRTETENLVLYQEVTSYLETLK